MRITKQIIEEKIASAKWSIEYHNRKLTDENVNLTAFQEMLENYKEEMEAEDTANLRFEMGRDQEDAEVVEPKEFDQI